MRNIEKPLFEGLESRLMLSTWVITGLNTGTVDGNPFNQSNINGTAGDDTIVYDGPTAEITGQIDGLGGRDTLIYAPTADGVYVTDGDGTAGYGLSVDVDLQNGQATATGGITRIEEVMGDTGTGITNTLIGANTANQWHVTGADAGDIGGTGGFVFSHFANLTGGNGDDTFVFSDGMVITGALAGGGGTDAVDLSAYTTALYWNVTTANAGNIDSNGDPLDGVLFGFDGIENLSGGDAADAFVFSAGAEITGAVDGGNGNDTMDAAAMVTDLIWDITADDGGTMAAGVSTTGFSSVENIIGGAGRDEFLFHTGTSLTGAADGGGGLTDTLDYSGVSASQPIVLDLQTYAATGLNGGLAGGWSNIESAIGGGAEDILTGPDTANTWDITAYNVGTLNTTAFVFEGFEQLVGGAAGDQFVFQDAARLSSGVNGAGGADSIDMTAYQSNNNWRLTGDDAGWVQVSEGFMTFEAVEQLAGGDGVDSFVFDAAGSLTGNLVGDGSGNGGSDGADSLDLSRLGSPLTWNISGVNTGTAADGGTFGLNFSEIGTLVSGDGNDAFFLGDGCGVNGSVDAGGGDDTLDLSAWTANLTWAVTGDNSGTVTDTLSFDFNAVENLVSGAGDDDVVFSAGRTVSGTITGSGGHDTLDYSAYTTAVTFDRQAQSATGIFGGAANGFSAIEGVTGGSAADTLVGLDAGGTWHVTGVDNAGLIDGLFTFGSMENLTGGPGDDLFVIDDGLVLGGTVDAGDGNDTLSLDADASLGAGIGQTYATGSTWDVTADYAGDLALGGGTVPFVSVENLRGGDGNDAFAFADKQVVDVIRGGDGVNSMDITAFTVQVYITFAEGTTVDGTARIYYGVGDEHLMDFYAIQDIQKSTTTIIGSNYVDLTGSLAVDPIFERMSPNEQGGVTVTVTNEGNNAITENIDITIYASVDQVVQPGDLVLKQLNGHAISLEAGQSQDVVTTITLSGDVPAGTYHILAVIDSGDVVEETSEDNNLCVGDRPLNVVWEFGRVSGRTGVVLDVQDPNGTTVTFAMKGDGQGTIVGGNDFTEIILTGTSDNSIMYVISDKYAPAVTLNKITVLGSMNAIVAQTANLTGELSVEGSIWSVYLAGAAGQGAVVVEGNQHPVKLLNLGQVEDLPVDVAGGIYYLQALDWIDTDASKETVTAPWIASIYITGRNDNLKTVGVDEFLPGHFEADVIFTGQDVYGYAMRKTNVRGTVSGLWDLTGTGGAILGTFYAGATAADWQLLAPDSYVYYLYTLGDMAGLSLTGDYYGTIYSRGGLFIPTITANGTDGVYDMSIQKFYAGPVADVSVNAAGGIWVVYVDEWQDTDATRDTLNIGWVGSLYTKTGDFDADLVFTGQFQTGYSITKTSIKGAVHGLWDMSLTGGGIVGTVVAGSTAADWQLAAPDSYVYYLYTYGDINGVGMEADYYGTIYSRAALSVPAIVANGADPTYNISITNFNVIEAVTNTRVQTASDIYSIAIGGSTGSDFLAGVKPAFAGRRADSADDYLNDGVGNTARIGKIAINGWAGAPAILLEDSNFTTAEMGLVYLRNYDDDVDPSYGLTVLNAEANVDYVQYIDTANTANNWRWLPGQPRPIPLAGDHLRVI